MILSNNPRDLKVLCVLKSKILKFVLLVNNY